MITVSHLTEENRANLLKLATYLETLPDDHKEFDMRHFVDWQSNPLDSKADTAARLAYATGAQPLHECGTAACALGHGPAAGIPFTEKYGLVQSGTVTYPDWSKYSKAFVGNHNHRDHEAVWEFLFSSLWEDHDNQPRGAAGRIRYLLDGNQIPEDIDDKNAFDIELYENYVISKRN